MFDKINAGTKLSLRIGTDTIGDPIWEGDAYVTSWALSGGTGDGATYDAEFQGTGPLIMSTVVDPEA
jgi:hypothetical protein